MSFPSTNSITNMIVVNSPESNFKMWLADSVNLVEAKAKLDVQNRFGRTALMLAVLGRFVDIVALLVSAGANVLQSFFVSFLLIT